MFVDDKLYCDFCHGVIVFGQKHVQFRVPGSDGKSNLAYTQHHYRFKGDCWDQQCRDFSQDAAGLARPHVSSAGNAG